MTNPPIVCPFHGDKPYNFFYDDKSKIFFCSDCGVNGKYDYADKGHHVEIKGNYSKGFDPDACWANACPFCESEEASFIGLKLSKNWGIFCCDECDVAGVYSNKEK